MRILFVLFIVTAIPLSSIGQGCSDAGLCTVSALNTGFGKENRSTTGKFYTIFGLGEQNVINITTQIEANLPTFKNQTVQIKLPYNFTFGNLGSISGLGDLTISLNQQLLAVNKYTLSVVTGLKIPSNDANRSLNGFPLPMAYQTGLGTYDIILGVSLNIKTWHLSFGYQHPFGHNQNQFEHKADNPQYFNNYNQSYYLKRADDIMLRIEKEIKANEFNLAFSVLPIYHLSDDIIFGNQKVAGSSGLTLNLNAKANKQLKNNIALSLALGAPIIDRKVRPDGLTRSFVIMFSVLKEL